MDCFNPPLDLALVKTRERRRDDERGCKCLTAKTSSVAEIAVAVVAVAVVAFAFFLHSNRIACWFI